MSRRIDVELTSRRDDGSWTWRAAGARAPKGVVEEGVLPSEAKVGDVLRVEVESFIDGITIIAVLPPKTARAEPQRIELLDRGPEQLVTTTLASRGRGDRRPRRDGDRDRDRGERRPRGGPREGGERRPSRPAPEPKAKPKRLRPSRAHRREVVASLPEEQRPIAEELMRGGVPGVRAALDQQNEQARGEGKPEINPEPLLALAEELWPRMRTAEWRDRAEAALAEVDELDLRDLRSVVVAADSAARDDETRAMAGDLREALNRRVEEEHTKWLTELAELVADGRVVAALRRSSRPPKAGAPLPSDLARLLVETTNEALNGDIGVDRWSVLLDALSYSPVRSSVEPAAVPEAPSDELVAVVRKVASRLPSIAARFGVEAAPPPAPGRSGRRSRPRPERAAPDQGRRGARQGGESASGHIPPPPTIATGATGEPVTDASAPPPVAEVASPAQATAPPSAEPAAAPASTEQAESADTPVAAEQADPAELPAPTEQADPADAPASTEQAEPADTPVAAEQADPADAADAPASGGGAEAPAEGASTSDEQGETVDVTTAEAPTADTADEPARGEARPDEGDDAENAGGDVRDDQHANADF
ncbi:MAG: hypothetical protein GEV08_12635 [Acidimicrobiia bacterium]|nr:hypothetical protein [Acidimicrobiia bacterium]